MTSHINKCSIKSETEPGSYCSPTAVTQPLWKFKAPCLVPEPTKTVLLIAERIVSNLNPSPCASVSSTGLKHVFTPGSSTYPWAVEWKGWLASAYISRLYYVWARTWALTVTVATVSRTKAWALGISGSRDRREGHSAATPSRQAEFHQTKREKIM